MLQVSGDAEDSIVKVDIVACIEDTEEHGLMNFIYICKEWSVEDYVSARVNGRDQRCQHTGSNFIFHKRLTVPFVVKSLSFVVGERL